MVNTTEQGGQTAVYIPQKTFDTAIETLEQGLPPQLDRTVWRSLSGAVQGQIISAFRFLKLIDDDNNVQPTLKAIVNAKGEERNKVLREVFEAAYADIIVLAENSATRQQLFDAMRKKNVKGSTLDRAVRFYQKKAEVIGLPLSPLWDAGTSSTGNGKTRKRNSGTKPPPRPRVRKDEDSHGKNKDDVHDTIKLNSAGTVTLSMKVNVMALTPEDRTWLFDLVDKFRSYPKQ